MKLYHLFVTFYNMPEQREEIFSEIVSCINPLISKYSRFIEKSLRDDFVQEVLMKLHKILINEKIKLHHFRVVGTNIIFENAYDAGLLSKFIAQSKDNERLYLESLLSRQHFERFISALAEFVGQVKLISFLDKMIKNLSIDFRKQHKFLDIEFKESDFPVYDNYYRLINEIKTNLYLFADFERKVLEIILSSKFTVTQQDIADELKVSQQYIAKIFKIIREKLKNINKW